ncbi:MAG: glycosyltransferase family 2 protein [Candidatus Nealsonbacteria bacterium]|nr:glycosyltransferase family 2 protein [Candidatus Nealsonbacteria bacterium]
MQIIFWLSIIFILYCYFGYPMILVILGLFFKKKTKRAEISPLVSLLIVVYNEEKIIERKIENSLALDYPKNKLEIVVASESDDKTDEIVKRYREKGVKLFTYPGRGGKPYSIYRTLPKCQGEIIVFSDANAMFRKNVLRKLVRNFNDFRIGCVSGELKYINPQKAAVGKSEGIYWKYEILLKRLESKIHSVLGANGSIYAIRKKLYSPLSKYRGDDFDLPIRILQQKYGVVWEPEAVSEEEVYPETIKEFKRKVVIVGWHFRGAFILLKDSIKKFQFLLIFQLISHKILRWFVSFFLILIFLSNIFLLNNNFYLTLFVGQILFYLLALVGYLQEKRKKKINQIVNLAYYFCMVNFAALIGVIKGLFGLQKTIWEKVR